MAFFLSPFLYCIIKIEKDTHEESKDLDNESVESEFEKEDQAVFDRLLHLVKCKATHQEIQDFYDAEVLAHPSLIEKHGELLIYAILQVGSKTLCHLSDRITRLQFPKKKKNSFYLLLC